MADSMCDAEIAYSHNCYFVIRGFGKHRAKATGYQLRVIIYDLSHWRIVNLPSLFRLSPNYSSLDSKDEGAFGDMGTYRSKAPLDLRHCT